MRAIRIKIYQPTAHYRIPFTYQRRHTYPIPPYSTVIGFLCNMLGVLDQSCEIYQELRNCKVGISGRFEEKLTEYIWFRNLNKKAHEKYFGDISIREKNGEIDHIGGQSPMSVDVLENMHLNIHIASEKQDFLEALLKNLKEPKNRLEVMHIGRAEDWLVYENIEYVELQKGQQDKNYNNFFWIPQYAYTSDNIHFDFDNIEGLFFNLPVFSTIKDYEKTFDRNGERSFEYMRTKLNDGAIVGMEYLFDGELPVFLADLKYSK